MNIKVLYIGIMSCMYMYGMEQEYSLVSLDSSSTYDPVSIALSIENTKKQLRTVLKKSCCMPHNKLNNLETTLVTLREQQNKWHNEQTKNKRSIDLLLDKNNSQQNIMQADIVSLYDIKHTYDYVTNINLSRNQLQELPLYSIACACPNLEALDVSKNNIKFISYRDDTTYGIGTLPSLKKLVLSNNKLNQYDFGACFAMSPILEDIDLSDNNTLNDYTWHTISGWKQQDEQWPIINVCNTSLSNEMIIQLKQQYKNMSIEYFKKNKALEYKDDIVCAHLITGLSLAGGGIVGTLISSAITQNPWCLFGLLGTVTGMTTYMTISLGFSNKCANIYAGTKISHEQRMMAGTKAEKNIIHIDTDDSIV